MSASEPGLVARLAEAQKDLQDWNDRVQRARSIERRIEETDILRSKKNAEFHRAASTYRSLEAHAQSCHDTFARTFSAAFRDPQKAISRWERSEKNQGMEGAIASSQRSPRANLGRLKGFEFAGGKNQERVDAEEALGKLPHRRREWQTARVEAAAAHEVMGSVHDGVSMLEDQKSADEKLLQQLAVGPSDRWLEVTKEKQARFDALLRQVNAQQIHESELDKNGKRNLIKELEGQQEQDKHRIPNKTPEKDASAVQAVTQRESEKEVGVDTQAEGEKQPDKAADKEADDITVLTDGTIAKRKQKAAESQQEPVQAEFQQQSDNEAVKRTRHAEWAKSMEDIEKSGQKAPDKTVETDPRELRRRRRAEWEQSIKGYEQARQKAKEQSAGPDPEATKRARQAEWAESMEDGKKTPKRAKGTEQSPESEQGNEPKPEKDDGWEPEV